jgi:hypothetical protein
MAHGILSPCAGSCVYSRCRWPWKPTCEWGAVGVRSVLSPGTTHSKVHPSCLIPGATFTVNQVCFGIALFHSTCQGHTGVSLQVEIQL